MKASALSLIRSLLYLPMALALSLALACGGDGNGSTATTTITGSSSEVVATSSSVTTTSSTGATGTTASGVTTTASPNSTTNTASSAAATGGGFGVVSSKLSSLNSYRYEVRLEGRGGPMAEFNEGLGDIAGTVAPNQNSTLEVSGAYVRPDRATLTIKVGSLSLSQTVIGTQEWSSFGGLTEGPLPATQSAAELSLAAAFWDYNDLSQNLARFSCESARSGINGVQARKCSIDKATFDQLQEPLGDLFDWAQIRSTSRFSLDAWLSDQGIPVRVIMDTAGLDVANREFSFQMTLNLSDINQPIEIKAP